MGIVTKAPVSEQTLKMCRLKVSDNACLVPKVDWCHLLLLLIPSHHRTCSPTPSECLVFFFFDRLSDKVGQVVTAPGIMLIISRTSTGSPKATSCLQSSTGSWLVEALTAILSALSCSLNGTARSIEPSAVGSLYVVFLSWCLCSSWRTLQWVITAPSLLFLIFSFLQAPAG